MTREEMQEAIASALEEPAKRIALIKFALMRAVLQMPDEQLQEIIAIIGETE